MFHCYANIPAAQTRIQSLARYFGRMPRAHLNVIDPIFIVDRFPGGRATSGGYWKPQEVRLWLGKERNTGVPDEDIQQYVGGPGGRGIIGVSRAAFVRGIYQFSVMHEVAHSVDHHLGIVPPQATVNDFRGVRYPGNSVGEYAAEAYARLIINRRRVCRDENIPRGENMSTCSRRLIGVLRRSPAFRTLPADWLPG